MNQLNLNQIEIEEFFNHHLPHKITLLRAHRYHLSKLDKNSLEQSIFSICSFESAFMAGRLFMEFLGIIEQGGKLKEVKKFREDDVTVEHLGGRFVKLEMLSETEKDILYRFLRRANKVSHLTYERPNQETRKTDGNETMGKGVVQLIERLLIENLYDIVGRKMFERGIGFNNLECRINPNL